MASTYREMASTYREILKYANSKLKKTNEGLWLLEELSNTDRSGLYLKLDEVVDDQTFQNCISKVDEVAAGLPIQYAIGYWQFRTIRLKVDNRCLIPRVETEKLVDLSLDIIKTLGKSEIRIIDLGTGSLCIPLSIAAEYKGDAVLKIYAVDFSDGALEIAKENLAKYSKLKPSIQIIKSSWFDSLDSKLKSTFDLVISNPPYLDKDVSLSRSVSEFEPHIALFSEDKGSFDTNLIINEAKSWTTAGGTLIIETDPVIALKVLAECEKNGYKEIELIRDQFGEVRFLKATA